MQPGMDRMFAMCRGVDEATAFSMKKWIDSNYHYMVPEMDETSRVLPNFTQFALNVQHGIDKLGANRATPVVFGPVSFARFMHFHTTVPGQAESLLQQLIPVYKELLQHLQEMGVTEVQIHEPVLVYEDDATKSLLALFSKAYPMILPASGKELSINMVSFFEDIGDTNFK
jgi:5-methyltetrahydropteroyltriglutamate--homocysteine methyltransferase